MQVRNSKRVKLVMGEMARWCCNQAVAKEAGPNPNDYRHLGWKAITERGVGKGDYGICHGYDGIRHRSDANDETRPLRVSCGASEE